MATVVVVLRSVTPPASSTPTECSVMAASVFSGSTSEIDPMNVVLPTAKPPATTILTTVGAVRSAAGCAPGAACAPALPAGACCITGGAGCA
jgi:hypothetical protein